MADLEIESGTHELRYAAIHFKNGFATVASASRHFGRPLGYLAVVVAVVVAVSMACSGPSVDDDLASCPEPGDEPPSRALPLGWRPSDPARIVDTRSATPLAPNDCVAVDVGAHTDLRRGDGVLLDVTVVAGARAGFVAAFECGGQVGETSVLNVDTGATASATFAATLGDDDSVCLSVSAGGHLVVDVLGGFTSEGDAPTGTATPLALGTTQLSAYEDTRLPVMSDASDATGLVANLTVQSGGGGFLAPCGGSDVSLYDFGAGTTQGQLLVPVDDGTICVRSSIDLRLSISSSMWFGPSNGDAPELVPRSRFDSRGRDSTWAEMSVGDEPVVVVGTITTTGGRDAADRAVVRPCETSEGAAWTAPPDTIRAGLLMWYQAVGSSICFYEPAGGDLILDTASAATDR